MRSFLLTWIFRDSKKCVFLSLFLSFFLSFSETNKPQEVCQNHPRQRRGRVDSGPRIGEIWRHYGGEARKGGTEVCKAGAGLGREPNVGNQDLGILRRKERKAEKPAGNGELARILVKGLAMAKVML